MSQEILPPDKTPRQKEHFQRVALSADGPLNGFARDVVPHTTRVRTAGFPPPPGGMIPSGRWWVWIEGGIGTEQRVMVNGATLIFPCGDWFVMDNEKFIAAKNSLLKMWWMDGFDLMEKTIDGYNNVGDRRAYEGYANVNRPALDSRASGHDQGDGLVLCKTVQRLPPRRTGIGGTDGPWDD